MKRKRFTYIPKDEIAEITTFNDVTFENDDILDGAYIKGRKKYARGGFTADSLEKQALQAVGIDSWFNMEESDRQGLVEELASSGVISEGFARGGYVSKGELVWKNLSTSKKMEFLRENFPEITPRSQEGLVNKDFQFLPKNVKIKLESKYANADGGYMAKGGKTNIDKFREQYDENEDNNAHSENVVLLAEYFGTKEDLKDAKNILAKHEAYGSIPSDLRNERDALHDKLWDKYKEKMGGYMADSGVATAATYMVKYYMKDAPKEIKEKIFTDKDKAELFYETLQDEDDIVVMPIVEVKEEVKTEAKPKSLFASAKPAPATAAAKKKRERVQVDGIADDINRYDELKAIINNAEAEKEIIGGKLKEIGRDKFLDIYEDTGRRPANFDLADGNENILLEVTDKYLKVEPEKAAILEKYDGLLEVVTTYEFNKDILEKKVSDDMTVGDVVSMLIQDSKLLSDSDKENLIKAKTTMRVPKGTLDRLMDYDNPREIFNLVAPVLALK